MRQLFIHVGPPKTGTSAIQFIMQQHAGDDVLYPHVGLWSDGSHHNLVFNHYGDNSRPEIERADPAELMARIGALAAAHPGNVLISSEALAGREVRTFAEALLAALRSAGGEWEARLLFTCREHFELVASLYNQSVKDAVMMERTTPDEYLAVHGKRLCYAETLQRLGDCGMPLQVVNYHPVSTFVPRFLRLVGYQGPTGVGDVRRNVSLSMPGLVATLAANRACQDRSQRDACFDALNGRIQPFFASSSNIFSAGAMQQAEALFAADRALIAERYGVQIPAPDIAARTSRFSLTATELASVAAAMEPLGELGQRVLDEARAFAAA